MSVQHFNKSFFHNALKQNSNSIIYLSTTFALILTLAIYGSIQGNLKAEYFVYGLMVSLVFFIWAIIEHKYRQEPE
ncbi:hypothetical protein [Acinetobacter sp. B51(2017)]|uniref:hypothetical protein n=1 Tax=Acinetobacter sp. B51(2017) TaxID=2060938 RepID=UPI000F08EB91|nr:hypothetical protein [Acinetobacter sp. B51(2017)]